MRINKIICLIILLATITCAMKLKDTEVFKKQVRSKLADYLLSKNKEHCSMETFFSGHIRYLLELEKEDVVIMSGTSLALISYNNILYLYTSDRNIEEISTPLTAARHLLAHK